MLKNLLTRETIKLHVSCGDWIEAIQLGTSILIEKGYVEKSYEQAIIECFKRYGPYMVIAPGIVLSHARPENGVNTLSMSLVTLKNPIRFGNETNDPVKLIITLAATDNETHLKALAQLMELLMNEENIKIIVTASDVDSVIAVIQEYSV